MRGVLLVRASVAASLAPALILVLTVEPPRTRSISSLAPQPTPSKNTSFSASRSCITATAIEELPYSPSHRIHLHRCRRGWSKWDGTQRAFSWQSGTWRGPALRIRRVWNTPRDAVTRYCLKGAAHRMRFRSHTKLEAQNAKRRAERRRTHRRP
ncbi:hypothetical protein C8R45DRAFT_973652 [Mycena sanguinolenta]|nr:hypothetical protein C8R45DRAFT_973652 [Mycena sanguinolenta]